MCFVVSGISIVDKERPFVVVFCCCCCWWCCCLLAVVVVCVLN